MNDEPNRRVQRILVAVHPSPHGLAALDVAARLAAITGAELRGVYVREERLLRLSTLAFLKEVDAVSGRVRTIDDADLQQQLRAEAARARHELARVAGELGLDWSFRVHRGDVAAVLGETAPSMDLVILGTRTRIAAPVIGSTVRALVEDSRHPVMVIREGMHLGRSVHAVDDGTEGGRLAVEVARALAEPGGAELSVHVGSETGAAERAESLRAELEATGRTRAVVRAAPGRGAFAPLEEAECGLVVLPRSSLRKGPDTLERVLEHAPCPVLVVG